MNMRPLLCALCAFFLVAHDASLRAQDTAPRARVLIVPGARPTGGRVVQIAPRPAATLPRAYEGVRPYRDWRWYGTSGPAIARANFEAYARRFAPSVARTYTFGWSAGRSVSRHRYR